MKQIWMAWTGDIEKSEHVWTTGQEAALQRGIDFRHFYDRSSGTLEGVVRFSEKACECVLDGKKGVHAIDVVHPGALHSVNPWALAFREDIFMINERQVTILETEHFGKLAYVEVGATCVGKIQQTHHGESFERGDEKGMFLFGGSTVIVLGEPGKWVVDDRILAHTGESVEAYLKMGQPLGRAL